MPHASLVWIDGEIFPKEKGFISVYDHGFTTGDGFFETVIIEKGIPFALRKHYLRLLSSGEKMGIPIPQWDYFRDGIRQLLSETGYSQENARLRITVTAGICPLGSDREKNLKPLVTITIGNLPNLCLSEHLVIVPYRRNEFGALRGVKSTSYAENVLALLYAKKRRGGEALFLNTKGEICEGTGSNIFLVRGNAVFTPNLESGCLPGVTREIVISLLEKEEILVKETSLFEKDLNEADALFLTSTLRKIQPVQKINERNLLSEKNPLVLNLQQQFLKLSQSGEYNGIPQQI